MTNFNFVHAISKLTSDAKIAYYMNVSRNLTVSIRGIWSDETLNAADKLERLKWSNELMHRVINRVIDLRTEPHIWNEEDIWQLLHTTLAQCPVIHPDMDEALVAAYEQTRQQLGDSINNTL